MRRKTKAPFRAPSVLQKVRICYNSAAPEPLFIAHPNSTNLDNGLVRFIFCILPTAYCLLFKIKIPPILTPRRKAPSLSISKRSQLTAFPVQNPTSPATNEPTCNKQTQRARVKRTAMTASSSRGVFFIFMTRDSSSAIKRSLIAAI